MLVEAVTDIRPLNLVVIESDFADREKPLEASQLFTFIMSNSLGLDSWDCCCICSIMQKNGIACDSDYWPRYLDRSIFFDPITETYQFKSSLDSLPDVGVQNPVVVQAWQFLARRYKEAIDWPLFSKSMYPLDDEDYRPLEDQSDTLYSSSYLDIHHLLSYIYFQSICRSLGLESDDLQSVMNEIAGGLVSSLFKITGEHPTCFSLARGQTLVQDMDFATRGTWRQQVQKCSREIVRFNPANQGLANQLQATLLPLLFQTFNS